MYALSIRTRFYNWLTLVLAAIAEYTYEAHHAATVAETSAGYAAYDSETKDVARELQKTERKAAELQNLVDRLSTELAEADSHADWLKDVHKYRVG